MSALPWVKLHTGLIDNDAFRLLSPEARLTFYTALGIAGKLGQNGQLSVRGVGPMNVAQIATYTGLKPHRQKQALDELCVKGAFLTIIDEAWAIAKWDEKAGDESSARSHADRQRRYRERHRDAASDNDRDASRKKQRDDNALHPPVTKSVTDIDKEVEIDSHLVTLGDATVTADAAPIAPFSEPQEQPKTRAPRQQKIPNPHELAAHQLLDAAFAVVVEHHELALSRQAWRDRNKAAALDFVRQGKSAEQVCDMLRAAYSGAGAGFYAGIVMLGKLAEHWPAIARADDSGGATPAAKAAAAAYMARNARVG